MDFTEVLLPEIVDRVFSFLDARELSTVSHCCARWRELTNKDALWYFKAAFYLYLWRHRDGQIL